jgi:hypothetical protein
MNLPSYYPWLRTITKCKNHLPAQAKRWSISLNEKRFPAINACEKARQKQSVFYDLYDDVQLILYVRS